MRMHMLRRGVSRGLHPTERRAQDANGSVDVTDTEAQSLLSSGGYVPSIGLAKGAHFRGPAGFHLVEHADDGLSGGTDGDTAAELGGSRHHHKHESTNDTSTNDTSTTDTSTTDPSSSGGGDAELQWEDDGSWTTDTSTKPKKKWTLHKDRVDPTIGPLGLVGHVAADVPGGGVILGTLAAAAATAGGLWLYRRHKGR